MSDLRTAALRALDALGLWATGRDMDAVALNDLIFRLEAALAEPQKPATTNIGCLGMPVNTPVTPPQRPAAPIIQPEIKDDKPFGYFRAEPFGWTDCAPTDEGAIPLYDRPQAQQFLYNAWADEQIQKEKK